MIYFDNNATTPMAPELKSLQRELFAEFGNASSVHQLGRRARARLEDAREAMAELLGASASALSFNSGATEAISQVLLGVFLPLNPKKNHLIVSAVEHAAVLETARFLQSCGVELSYLNVDAKGRIDLAELESLVRPETALIAVMWANNEIGNLYPVAEIGALAQGRGIFYLCDAVQVLGKTLPNLAQLPIDFLVASAHKFHGPKGAGFLYQRPGLNLRPLLQGGRQERGRRAGTENVAGCVLMAAALELGFQKDQTQRAHVSRLREIFLSGLESFAADFQINGDPELSLGNTLNLRFPGVSGESLLMNLDMAGVAASMGSACDSGSLEASHVLLAMGLKDQEALESLRFSFSRYNTEGEVGKALGILRHELEAIKKIL